MSGARHLPPGRSWSTETDGPCGIDDPPHERWEPKINWWDTEAGVTARMVLFLLAWAGGLVLPIVIANLTGYK